MHLTARLAALLLAASAMTPAAFAQTAAPAAPASAAPSTAAPAVPQPARHPPATRRVQAAAPTMESRVEARIAELHRSLAITPAEEGQWSQFAQVMRDNATTMNQALSDRAGHLGKMNAVDTLQSYESLAQLHAQNVQKLAAAFQPLYAALTDTQKQAADSAFRPPARSRPARPAAGTGHATPQTPGKS